MIGISVSEEIILPILNTSTGSSIDEGFENDQKKYLRFIFALWLLMTLVLNNVYQIIVISELIEPIIPDIPWKNFAELPTKLKKYVLLDKSISNFEKQLEITSFNSTEGLCYRVKKGRSQMIIRPPFDEFCDQDPLFVKSHHTIFAWHLSSFGRLIRDNALTINCRHLKKNQNLIQTKSTKVVLKN